MEESPNLSYILNLADGDFIFAEKFTRALKEEFQDEVQTYFEHINNSEPRSAAEFVSKIKQKFTMLSLTESFATADYHQRKLQEGDLSLDFEFRKLIRKVNTYLRDA